MPGVKKEDVKVAIDGQRVTIEGECRKANEQREGERWCILNARHASTAQLHLPSEVDDASAQARWRTASCMLTLPKKQGGAARQRIQNDPVSAGRRACPRAARAGMCRGSGKRMAEFRRFKNRAQAGKLLAQKLGAYAPASGRVVLALPRGGVPVAFAVASGSASNSTSCSCASWACRASPSTRWAPSAAAACGTAAGRARPDGRDAGTGRRRHARELAEMQRRERAYRGGRPPLAGRTQRDPGRRRHRHRLDDAGRDRGGAPAWAGRWSSRPGGAARHAGRRWRRWSTNWSAWRHRRFRAVSQWYDAFDQTSDEEVQDLLADGLARAGRPTATTKNCSNPRGENTT
jgi:putative phosphoribosyl transferase